MIKEKFPTTPAILALKAQGAYFTLHTYPYEEKGGTKKAAGKLMVDEHRIIKTLIMEDETSEPFIILMHGDKEVSTKSLAKTINDLPEIFINAGSRGLLARIPVAEIVRILKPVEVNAAI